MDLQKFAKVDPGSNHGKAVEKQTFVVIKFKWIMIVLSEAKSNISMWYSSKWGHPFRR